MKRRDFINSGLLAAFSGAIASPLLVSGCKSAIGQNNRGKAKNIIFLVSDGMSTGTLNMADLLMQRKLGKSSTWLKLYRENKVKRALMDTASADCIVTDSAAASSAWGGGVRVNNGSLNVAADGTKHKPILQKFKEAGKKVGCVTTVPITHATPAGFSINVNNRRHQDRIASMYLALKFDVMMGGGTEYFDGSKREDKKNIFGDFVQEGFQLVQSKKEMMLLAGDKPVMGVFNEDGMPYALDHQSDKNLIQEKPSLAEMAEKAISLMKDHPEGFVLQVEGGKVDWAAHGNDAAALLYDQMAFDEAVEVAIKFAEQREDTLVVITTDHGNSNPGLIKSKDVNEKFDLFHHFKHTNEWILHGIKKEDSVANVIERINYAQGYNISKEDAKSILKGYSELNSEGLYNSYKLPFKDFAQIQEKYISVHWSGMNHSADFVELAMFGAGSEALPAFVKNTDIHNYLLAAAEVQIPAMSMQ